MTFYNANSNEKEIVWNRDDILQCQQLQVSVRIQRNQSAWEMPGSWRTEVSGGLVVPSKNFIFDTSCGMHCIMEGSSTENLYFG